MGTQRKLTAAVVIGVMAALVAWALNQTTLLDAAEDMTWDRRQIVFARPVGRDVPIRLILLDEQSLEWAEGGMGIRWPWPYELYTPIIRFCRDSGAKAIVFDVQFYDGGRYGLSDDRKLCDVVAAGKDVALAVVPGEDPAGIAAWPETLNRPDLNVPGFEEYIASHGTDDLVAERCRFSFEQLSQSAAILGHITPFELEVGGSKNQVVRRIKPLLRFDGQNIPALGLAAYLIHEDVADGLRVENDVLHVGNHSIPLGSDGHALLRYRKPLTANNDHLYRSYSASAVIQSHLRALAGEEPTIKSEEFKDCYVFFGFSTPGSYDSRPAAVSAGNPVAEKLPGAGVEVQATLLDNLINSGYLVESSWYSVWLFTLFISIISATSVLIVSGWVRVTIVYVLFLPIPVLVGSVLFVNNIAWPIIWPMLGVSMALVGATSFDMATEGRRRAFIKRAFGHSLSPTVIENVLADPTLLKLDGERREVTVMFIDLEGFTSMAEKLVPDHVSGLLNEYLSRMSEAILEEDGTVDKFEGDAVMAFWNAPLDQPDHALRACRAALKCKEKVVGLRRLWFEKTGKDPRIRIGIHTGECIVGNMGAKQRFDYTVLGDTANLASRLEGVNKVFGTTILVSSQTWEEVGEALAGRGIARVLVAGRKEPVIVIEPYGTDPNMPHSTGEAFDEALSFCEQGRYVDAMHRFHKLSQDPVSRVYAEHLAEILKMPEPAWDGIWHIRSR